MEEIGLVIQGVDLVHVRHGTKTETDKSNGGREVVRPEIEEIHPIDIETSEEMDVTIVETDRIASMTKSAANQSQCHQKDDHTDDIHDHDPEVVLITDVQMIRSPKLPENCQNHPRNPNHNGMNQMKIANVNRKERFVQLPHHRNIHQVHRVAAAVILILAAIMSTNRHRKIGDWLQPLAIKLKSIGLMRPNTRAPQQQKRHQQ